MFNNHSVSRTLPGKSISWCGNEFCWKLKRNKTETNQHQKTMSTTTVVCSTVDEGVGQRDIWGSPTCNAEAVVERPSDRGFLLDLLEKLAAEVVMAEEGSDSGQLPILDLLGNLRDASASDPLLEQFHACARDSAEYMVTVVEAMKPFAAENLRRLGQVVDQLKQLIANPKMSYVPPLAVTTEAMHDKDVTAVPVPVTDKSPSTPAACSSNPGKAAGVSGVVAEEEMPLNVNLESDAELLKEFINESHEHLNNIEQGVLVLEENPTDADTLNTIFRAFHTFKGGAGFLNLMPISRFAHEMESLLDMARQHKLEITRGIIDLILQGGDTLKKFIVEIEMQIGGQKPPSSIVIPTNAIKAQVRAALEGRPPPACAPAPPPERPAASTPVPQLPVPATQASVMKPAKQESQREDPPADDAKTPLKSTQTAAVVKVDTQKLDSVVDTVGELVIAESLVMQDPDLHKLDSQQLDRNLAQLRRITNELQRMTMAMRMVPIRATFQKMSRIVRDLSAKLGKQVQLTLGGEDTEVDRTIVEEISDPLMHMVRNAVDHGIESPEKRVAAGKPAQGHVCLRAFHRGGNVVIEIKDDGGGLNKAKILAKAIEKGLVSPNEELTDQEIYSQVFAPGFSTAEQVTDVSGRGVGMDVVMRNIEKLRGKVEIESTPGQGATFSIYLPLTLAIIEGLVVNVGEQRYIIPTLSIRESFRPAASMLSTIHERGEMVNVRGKLIPLLRLHKSFGVKPLTTDPTQAIVLVVESGHESRCVMVDQLVGKQEVVIKGLGEMFKNNRFMAGGAILGDGRVGLILDASALVKLK
jgi:two-component system chemotaxis sensor kinase CheA